MFKNEASILIVDDCPEHINVIIKALPCQYKRQFALSAEEAIYMVKNNVCVPDIVIVVNEMNGFDGFDLCRRFKGMIEINDIPIVFVSSIDNPQFIEKAFAVGAIDYIKKPFYTNEFIARLEGHLENHIVDKKLRMQNVGLLELAGKRTRDIMKSQMATIYALVKLSELRDSYTCRHLERVASVSGLIAEKYMKSENEKKINNDYINILKQAAILHDIGKVGISDNILMKNGKLSHEEFDKIKQHTVIGATTIKSVYDEFPDNSFLRMAVEIARYHHEKWNGKGYPEGLNGMHIPLSARIVSLADTYDALRSERPYKKMMSHADSIKIIKGEKGNSFDPLLIDLFIEIESEIEELYMDIICCITDKR